MRYKEYSTSQLKEEAIKLSKEISKDFNPDIVVFIAKGGFYIGKYISEYFGKGLYEVFGERRGSILKKIISPLFKLLPSRIRFWLIDLEMHLGIHRKVKNRKRNIQVSNLLENLESDNIKKILLVDDSVDTGYSLVESMNLLKSLFPCAEIRTAAFCVIRYSEDIVKTDFYSYKDTIIKTSTSKDSSEHELFLIEYQEWREHNR